MKEENNRNLEPTSERADDAQAGIDSVETGMRLLIALSRLGGDQTLTAIAAASGLPPPRAHRYLVSLVRSGLAERHAVRGYRLGPVALEIGVNALASIDVVQVATEALAELRDELNQAVALMVWGRDGPVIIRTEESHHPISLRLRVGQPLPVLSSASGIILAAHLPWAVVSPIIEAELACAAIHNSDTPPSLEQVRQQLAEARRRGLSRIIGTLTPGIAAFATPVFDAAGKVVASLSVIAPSDGFNAAWTSKTALALRRVSSNVSGRLGYRAPGEKGRTTSAVAEP